ncbi:probable pancreatic secretory proteinase inhibitor isoform X1 [Colossoma macropomum]|uniref:probable pancreatic secretory proteinase inhibitor isoform X1 n=1 Tax=Colossoma macropomum TaxID=42526 RepID=UPI0018648678|nr:probable pancreatic secretory proteinase inhibitor isoform X1 [Colossoma macropomum]
MKALGCWREKRRTSLTPRDAEDKSRLYRRPACGDMSLTHACPLNYSPVCGNDGITYPNECALCVHRLQTNTDILIVKEGSC